MTTPTPAQIKSLELDAGTHGDTALVATCRRALDGSKRALSTVARILAAAEREHPAQHAAVQLETKTIYGVGASAAEARKDAARYTEHPDRLHVTTITDAAADHVRAHGGQPSAAISFDRNGICLASEE